MKIALIVAMDEAGGIGIEDRLPWRLSADLKRFKRLTMGHHLVLGRRTYQTIGKPLSGREMLILSRNPHFLAPGCQVVASLQQAIQIALEHGESVLWIAGGAEIYRIALPLADSIYLTRVQTKTPVDTYFLDIDESDWIVQSTQSLQSDPDNEYATTFSVMEKAPK